MTEDPIRVLIVDDSALYRLLIRDVLGGIPGCSVVGVAENGARALEKIETLAPDLITLDVEMPEMTGMEVLRAMNRRGVDAKAIMLSRFTDAGAKTTTDALLEGAFDFICKPSASSPTANKASLKRELINKIAAYREGRQHPPSLESELKGKPNSNSKFDEGAPDRSWKCAAVIIGCSTGGPEALRLVLPKLPHNFPVPVIVVQHMPKQFTHALAQRLDTLCALEVVEAQQGMPVVAGKVFVAPGGRHLQLTKRNDQVMIRITDDPPEHNCRPAVDYTLRSACESFDSNVLAVILTGMGRDGLLACGKLKQLGGRVVAQHSAGCTVYGMPKAVIEAELTDRVAKLPHLAKVVCDEVR